MEDDATQIGEGQMKKSELLARLRTEVCAAAEAGLASTQYASQGCPLIELWLGYYGNQSAERINETLQRFVEEGRRPTTAEGYVSLIASRVRASVTTWARTGEITGVPRGIPLPGMGLPGLGSLGGLLGGLGGVFFKAKPGGPRDPGNPVVLQARLGAGRPLDGTIRSRMESTFGRGFSHVRVHTDGAAAGLSAGFNARAFTVGHHLAFGPQEYRPGTLTGDALIAHELAHVAQQDGASEAVQPMSAGGAGHGALERDADQAALGAVASLWGLRLPGLRLPLRAAPRLSSGLRLQRCGGCGKAEAQTPATPQPGRAPAGPQKTPEPRAAGPQQPAAQPPQKNAEAFCATESDHAGIVALRVKAGLPAPVGNLVYGFTYWEPKKSATEPKLDIDWTSAGNQWTGTVEPTTAAMGNIEALYLKEGTHEVPGRKVKASFPQCTPPGKEVPFYSRLSKDLSLLSRRAEQEHCDDYQQAFNLTYKVWADNINSLAGNSFGPGSKAEVKKQIHNELVKKGDKGRAGWVAELNRLNALSISKRDGNGWHSLKSTGEPVTPDATCSKLEGMTAPTASTQVPGPSSKDLIK